MKRAPIPSALALVGVTGLLSTGLVLGSLAPAAASETCVRSTDGGETVTCSWVASGTEQTFVVPDGVTSLALTAVGGAGGDGATGLAGGSGVVVHATLPVQAGQQLYLTVGGDGGNGVASTRGVPAAGGAGGAGGGAPGGAARDADSASAGGGGGASDVRTVPAGTPGSLSSRVLVAAGGGGASSTPGGAADATAWTYRAPVPVPAPVTPPATSGPDAGTPTSPTSAPAGPSSPAVDDDATPAQPTAPVEPADAPDTDAAESDESTAAAASEDAAGPADAAEATDAAQATDAAESTESAEATDAAETTAAAEATSTEADAPAAAATTAAESTTAATTTAAPSAESSPSAVPTTSAPSAPAAEPLGPEEFDVVTSAARYGAGGSSSGGGGGGGVYGGAAGLAGFGGAGGTSLVPAGGSSSLVTEAATITLTYADPAAPAAGSTGTDPQTGGTVPAPADSTVPAPVAGTPAAATPGATAPGANAPGATAPAPPAAAPAPAPAAGQRPAGQQSAGSATGGSSSTETSVRTASSSRVEVSATHQEVEAGGVQTVLGSGFTPGERVRGTLHSTPVDLGTVIADDRGEVSFTVQLPEGFEVGDHHVVLEGTDSGRFGSVGFVVASATSAIGEVGRLVGGSEVGGLTVVLVGLVALAVAGGLLAAARRTSGAPAEPAEDEEPAVADSLTGLDEADLLGADLWPDFDAFDATPTATDEAGDRRTHTLADLLNAA